MNKLSKESFGVALTGLLAISAANNAAEAAPKPEPAKIQRISLPRPASRPAETKLPTCGNQPTIDPRGCVSRPSTAPGNVFGIVPETNDLYAAELLAQATADRIMKICGAKRSPPVGPYRGLTLAPKNVELAGAPPEYVTITATQFGCVEKTIGETLTAVSAVKPNCHVRMAPMRQRHGLHRMETFCTGRPMPPRPTATPASKPTIRPAKRYHRNR